MRISKIGVVGAGAMGNGISQAFAVSGYDVVKTDVGQAQVDRGLATISGSLDRLVKKEKLSVTEKGAAITRIRGSVDLGSVADCDLIIEAATESLALKRDLFSKIDRLARPEAIIATNTSSISITRLAAATGRPDRLIGMHFFQPGATHGIGGIDSRSADIGCHLRAD